MPHPTTFPPGLRRFQLGSLQDGGACLGHLKAAQIVARNGIIPWYDRGDAKALLARCVADGVAPVERAERFGRAVDTREVYEGDLVDRLKAISDEAFAAAEKVALRYDREQYSGIVEAVRFDVTPGMAVEDFRDRQAVLGEGRALLGATGILALLGGWGYCGALFVNWAFPL